MGQTDRRTDTRPLVYALRRGRGRRNKWIARCVVVAGFVDCCGSTASVSCRSPCQRPARSARRRRARLMPGGVQSRQSPTTPRSDSTPTPPGTAFRGPDLLQAGPLFRKNVGPLIYEYPVTHPHSPTVSGPTRTVVIVDILLRTRAAMHTTIAAAADWHYFNISGLSPCCKKWRKNCPFVGPLFWGPFSAKHAEHA